MTMAHLSQKYRFYVVNPSKLKHLGVSKNRGTASQNGWFIMENPIKMDDLGVPLFSETRTFVQIVS